MFSPPPGGTPRLRRHVRPYKLAPIQREMFIQEAISDSPFYSTSAYYEYTASETPNDFQKLPPISAHPGSGSAPQRSQGSSLPMLIMTDDGGDDWEVLSEVKKKYFIFGKEIMHQNIFW